MSSLHNEWQSVSKHFQCSNHDMWINNLIYIVKKRGNRGRKMIQTMGENTVNSQKREIIIMKKKIGKIYSQAPSLVIVLLSFCLWMPKFPEYKIQHQKYSVRQTSWVTDR